MTFIEIADGVSIRMDEIEAVGKRDEMMSIVYTHHNSYDSTFPYNVLLELLEGVSAEKMPKPEIEQINILKQAGYFAG